mgnify:CR=1 FL=1
MNVTGMRILVLIFTLWIFAIPLLAQPVYDDCSSALDLGVLPFCESTFFSNRSATTPLPDTLPDCAASPIPWQDVWFSFSVPNTESDWRIAVRSASDTLAAIQGIQMALYSGDCARPTLHSCGADSTGINSLSLSATGLVPGQRYRLRLAHIVASGAFQICIQPLQDPVAMGQRQFTNDCFGRLTDSGGDDQSYGNNENHTFTICSQPQPTCVSVTLDQYDLEPDSDFFTGDRLLFYGGSSINAPLIGAFSGSSNQPITLQSNTACLTVAFQSDGFVTRDGFVLDWSCSDLPCTGSTFEQPTLIPGLPFTTEGSTCNAASTFAESPCGPLDFLQGPEVVYAFDSPGGICADLRLRSSEIGHGLLVLNGPPQASGTVCIGQSDRGLLSGIDFRTAGRYYIIVAGSPGCGDYDLEITPGADCPQPTSLRQALCNPLNNCFTEGDTAITLSFQDNVQDIPLIPGLNAGCWENTGAEPDFRWFSLQTKAEGQLAFDLRSGDLPSDIDFNIWGPFRPEDACTHPDSLIALIQTTQPVRSSYAGEPLPTGLLAVHPRRGYPVTDTWDCPPDSNQPNDDYVRPISVRQGELYVVLVNDFGNAIRNRTILLDLSATTPGVLRPVLPQLIPDASVVCPEDTTRLRVTDLTGTVSWLPGAAIHDPDSGPVAVVTPSETTTYRAVVESTCRIDTLSATVFALEPIWPTVRTLCLNGQFRPSLPDFPTVNPTWTASDALRLSCTECAQPTVTGVRPGTWPLFVDRSLPTCTRRDTILVEVLPNPAPNYQIGGDTSICRGDTLLIGGPALPETNYRWTSSAGPLDTTAAFIEQSPSQKTTYFLEARNDRCPLPVRDSVVVEVFEKPKSFLIPDTTVCQDADLQPWTGDPEPGVRYHWFTPNDTTGQPGLPRPFPADTPGTYQLQASRSGCTVRSSFELTIIPLRLNLSTRDTAICQGTSLSLSASLPEGADPVQWQNSSGQILQIGPEIRVQPLTTTPYFAFAKSGNCTTNDTVLVRVDSLPADRSIRPADTTICLGQTAALSSPAFDPAHFPELQISWMPQRGQESPPDQFSLVARPETDVVYQRVIRSGACQEMDSASIRVQAPPDLFLSIPDTVLCPGASVPVSVHWAGDSTALPRWSPATGLSCDRCTDPVLRPNRTTTYTVRIQPQSGCPAETSVTIRIQDTTGYEPPENNIICRGDSLQLNQVARPDLEYRWLLPDGQLFSTHPQPVVQPDSNTLYQLALTDSICGTRTFFQRVEVVEVQEFALNVSTDAICPGDSVTLTGSAVGGSSVESFQWLSSSGQRFDGPVWTVFPDTTTQFTLLYQPGACGQVYDLRTRITVEPLPQLSLTPQPMTAAPGTLVNLLVRTDTIPEGSLLIWLQNDQEIGQTESGPFAISAPEEDTRFGVRLETPLGCTYLAETVVRTLIFRSEMPNAFTPNGDGRNDFFNLVYRGGEPIIQDFRIYNRWGGLVYNNQTPEQGWDGQFRGEPQPAGVYIFQLTYTSPRGDRRTIRGEVTLIR